MKHIFNFFILFFICISCSHQKKFDNVVEANQCRYGGQGEKIYIIEEESKDLFNVYSKVLDFETITKRSRKQLNTFSIKVNCNEEFLLFVKKALTTY